MPDTPLLDTVHVPADMRAFDAPRLRQLADELRAETGMALGIAAQYLARNKFFMVTRR